MLAFVVKLAQEFFKLRFLIVTQHRPNLVPGLLPYCFDLWIHSGVECLVFTLCLVQNVRNPFLLIRTQSYSPGQFLSFLRMPCLSAQDGRLGGIATMGESIAQHAAQCSAQNENDCQPERSFLSNRGFRHRYLSAELSRKSS